VVVRGSGGTYKLIKKLSALSPPYNAANFRIPGPGTWYFTFTPGNAAYKLGYRDNTANNAWLNIQSVTAQAYDTDNPTNKMGGGLSGPGNVANPNEGGAAALSFSGFNPTLGFINTAAGNKVLVTVTSWNNEEGDFELTLASLATPSLPVTAGGASAVSYSIARNAILHYGFAPPTTTATYDFTWDLPATGNVADITGVRAYTYTLGTGGLGGSTSLNQSTANSLGSPFAAGTRVFIEVQDGGSGTAATGNFTLTVR
jgi:hypothetical protein